MKRIIDLETDPNDIYFVDEEVKQTKTNKMEHYTLKWKGEEIDTAETREEALFLKTEYNLAYGGGVTIVSTSTEK